MATTIITFSSTTTPHFPPKSLPIRPQFSIPKKPLLLLQQLKPFTFASIFSITAIPLPALSEQIEKAALFDFNLTLPAIALEFLLLMVALDKIYFTPLGKFMADRDSSIRAQLADVKDTSGEVKQLDDQAAAVMKAARAEISAALNKMKKETTAGLEEKLAEGKRKVESEIAEAIAALESEKEETLKALEAQITVLGDEIVSKVLPSN